MNDVLAAFPKGIVAIMGVADKITMRAIATRVRWRLVFFLIDVKLFVYVFLSPLKF
jgi:hypothetical protein